MKPEEPQSYEQAFERLEKILEMMNSGKVSLEESLKLYEEAEKLMHFCSNALTSAERKIEQLIKNRSGEIVLDHKDAPKTEPLSHIIS